VHKQKYSSSKYTNRSTAAVSTQTEVQQNSTYPINWDGEPFAYAEIRIIDFSLKMGYNGSLEWKKKILHTTDLDYIFCYVQIKYRIFL
jgi:hypothetical protein